MIPKIRVTYCDGSGWNGTNCAICVHRAWIPKRNKIFLKVIYERVTVHKIEYLALIKAIELARAKSKNVIYTDNKNVYLEINRLKQPKDDELFTKAVETLIERREESEREETKIEVNWISRYRNLAGIYLEKRLKKLHNYVTPAYMLKAQTRAFGERRRLKYIKHKSGRKHKG